MKQEEIKIKKQTEILRGKGYTFEIAKEIAVAENALSKSEETRIQIADSKKIKNECK